MKELTSKATYYVKISDYVADQCHESRDSLLLDLFDGTSKYRRLTEGGAADPLDMDLKIEFLDSMEKKLNQMPIFNELQQVFSHLSRYRLKGNAIAGAARTEPLVLSDGVGLGPNATDLSASIPQLCIGEITMGEQIRPKIRMRSDRGNPSAVSSLEAWCQIWARFSISILPWGKQHQPRLALLLRFRTKYSSVRVDPVISGRDDNRPISVEGFVDLFADAAWSIVGESRPGLPWNWSDAHPVTGEDILLSVDIEQH